MKKYNLGIMFLLMAVLVSACSAPASTASPAAEVPTQLAATEAVVTDAPTEPAVTAAIPESGSSSGTQVTITLADNTIESSQTAFQVGVPYTFVITNTGRHAHNFNVSTPVAVVGSLDAALEGALLAVPQSQLSAGASVTVEYTFPDTAAGQNLEFSCLIRRHYADGMLLPITVTS
jgi:uncharacterized cupredoxin-like copper-binding protein